MTPADTPDIVERLRAIAAGVSRDSFGISFTEEQAWQHGELLTEAADTILALRAAQSPQARDEGGAVEVLRAALFSACNDLAAASGTIRGLGNDRLAAACFAAQEGYRTLAAAAPSPPTDEAWLAQKGETATGLMRKPGEGWTLSDEAKAEIEATKQAQRQGARDAQNIIVGNPASPPQAPQEVAELVAEARTWLERHSQGDVRWPLISRLAAALTPRELTDEEAERGARAYCEALRQEAVMIVGEPDDYQPFATGYDGLDATQRGYLLAAIRAAYRAITEEPAR